jgi:glycine betaine/proline transport system substrate-binding protein
MENEVMSSILDEGKTPEVSAKEWLKKNPAILDNWLVGVKTSTGNVSSVSAVKSHLGL